MTLIHGLRFNNLRGDIFGGLTAAVVALPLALAFGVASGAGPLAGLYGAIFVGFFAALFGGTPTQISGPTGPMTVVMAAIFVKFSHDPALAFTVVIMGGGFQILFGAMRLGRYIALVPFPVISGFMSGIGCIIMILQFAPLIGATPSIGGVLDTVTSLPGILANAEWQAAAVGLLALTIASFTPRPIASLVPSSLIALIVGTSLVWLFLPEASVLGNIPSGIPTPHLPHWTWTALPDMISSALILALLGSIDSLLTSLVADNITRTSHHSNRELIGQGIGNMIAGLFGGIPGAGATMRTVINVRTGGETPISGMLHAIILLAVLLVLGPVAEHIPHAVLAGILFKTGIDIIDWGYLRRVFRAPHAGVIIMLVTLILTVFVDLIIAVAVGTIAASLLFVKRMSVWQLSNVRDGNSSSLPVNDDERETIERLSPRMQYYHFSGPLSFGAAKGINDRLSIDISNEVLILDLADVAFVDTSASVGFEAIIAKAQDAGLAVLVVRSGLVVMRVFERLGIAATIGTDNLFPDRRTALMQAEMLLEQTSHHS
jgi:SulP family sulfate permease